jgi:hypothetical protein
MLYCVAKSRKKKTLSKCWKVEVQQYPFNSFSGIKEVEMHLSLSQQRGENGIDDESLAVVMLCSDS